MAKFFNYDQEMVATGVRLGKDIFCVGMKVSAEKHPGGGLICHMDPTTALRLSGFVMGVAMTANTSSRPLSELIEAALPRLKNLEAADQPAIPA